MAQQIKFRLTAAKVGVSAALLALIGGVVERVRSAPSDVQVTPASQTNVLHRAWPMKYSAQASFMGKLENKVIKLQDKWIKLDTALSSVEHKLAREYLKIRDAGTEFLKIKVADVKFLKIADANDKFLKIADANDKFLKIGDAATEYLKIKLADATFLKIRDANAKFLKIKTAQSEFLQGQGGVVSGALTMSDLGSVDQRKLLLQTPDGLIKVSVGASNDFVDVFVQNGTGQTLDAVAEASDQAPGQPGTTSTKSITLSDKTPTSVFEGVTPGTHQLHLQIFPANGFNNAITLTVSLEPERNVNGQVQAVGQMLIGLL
ncbi:MAG: hypothetical protein ACJ764_14850 [Solirubrobacteraceae bacterium]